MAPHLALKPPYFFFGFVCFLIFLFVVPLLFLEEKLVSLPKKGRSCLFSSVSHCFSLALVPPLLHSRFLCLCLVLFFLPFLLPCFCLFVSLLCFFVLFHEQNNIKISY